MDKEQELIADIGVAVGNVLKHEGVEWSGLEVNILDGEIRILVKLEPKEDEV